FEAAGGRGMTDMGGRLPSNVVNPSWSVRGPSLAGARKRRKALDAGKTDDAMIVRRTRQEAR
ncbi:MAG TPA: hypothetical protein VEH77_18755, partial [Roseiarcus sp.]|nr:hypothetical protein [Roseiarcus sp.]